VQVFGAQAGLADPEGLLISGAGGFEVALTVQDDGEVVEVQAVSG
jgi:hypothetical protein